MMTLIENIIVVIILIGIGIALCYGAGRIAGYCLYEE
jgi:hypothetical protein